MEKKTFPRAKTPSILQMEAVECGAASLTMVLGYFEKYLPLSQVRKDCGVSRDGSKASNVLRAARMYDLEADGYRLDPSDLAETEVPAIIHWNFNHFLVLEGIVGDKVYLNDPASGPRVVSKKELDESFTGIALTFKKTPKFKPGGEQRTTIKALKKRFKGIELALSYVVIAGLALVIPGLAIPTFSKLFIDNVLMSRMEGWVLPLMAGMVFMGLLKVALARLQSKFLSRLQKKIAVSTSSQFFWHVLKMPMTFFYQRFGGEIVGRVEINEEVASVLSGELASMVIDVFMVAFYALLMFQYSWLLTLVGVTTGLLNILFLRYISQDRINQSKKMLQESGKLYSVSMSGIKMIESIKAGGGEAGFFSKWSGHHAKVIDYSQELGASSVIISIIPSLLTTLNGIAILSLGSMEVLTGGMTIGMLIAFQSLMGSFIGPVNSLISFSDRIQTLKGNMDRLDDVMENPVDPIMLSPTADPENVKETDKVKLDGYIELKNLTFGYSPLEPALIKGFNLKLKPGSRVALVGMSGSGKSTTTKVVSGLYQQWDGDILFDGISTKELPRDLINNSLSVVDQEIISFEGSVRDNIKLWDDTISDADMIQAAKDAEIHDAIVARKEGYDFKIAEDGSGFSGGQMQRIEIARALSTNPTILLLDEATSALDTKTEKTIDDNIRRRGCTCMIVAHRLSTVRDADEIIVLEKGKIVQRGTHDELKNKKGLYATLVKSI